ncbi:HK97-gp10 family putative phage morphogenesis protein [Rhizobium sp. PL01]|uniref:HK97-gp10 family putative phage morphogenesis protein n=1 Tax=Rhizobium sp. PL01 TaxID=3085631 RepID=UPI002981B904|nr:HK97-gp10 family putative phage morphogenesis protein [Rhizobium sp. PL01]MDW5314086.1 HK97 gp10 family phage protein [Rhizobium sp. PL01]
MANKNDNGLASTLAAFDRVRMAPRAAIRPALAKAGHDLADTMQLFAQSSRDTGALMNSIEVTAPGESTPSFSQPGGARVAGEAEVIVTAGNEAVRYPHLVEYGTADTEAQPFFWPAFRLRRQQLLNQIARAGRKAVRDEWNNKT